METKDFLIIGGISAAGVVAYLLWKQAYPNSSLASMLPASISAKTAVPVTTATPVTSAITPAEAAKIVTAQTVTPTETVMPTFGVPIDPVLSSASGGGSASYASDSDITAAFVAKNGRQPVQRDSIIYNGVTYGANVSTINCLVAPCPQSQSITWIGLGLSNPAPLDLGMVSSSYPSGLVENQVVKGDSTASIWMLNGGNKWSLSYDWDKWGDPSFTTVNEAVVDSIPVGAGTYWSGDKPSQLNFTNFTN